MSVLRVGFSNPTNGGYVEGEQDDIKNSQRTDPGVTPTEWEPPKTKMVIKPKGSKSKLVIPFAPQQVTYTGLTNTWTETTRDGDRSPLLLPQQRNLKKMAFKVKFADRRNRSWSGPLRALEKIAKGNRPVHVVWSSWEAGLWRITNMTVTSQRRHPRTNEISFAEVDLEFTRASDAKTNIGPASGGKKGDNTVKNGPDGDKGGGKGRPKKYKVKAGDTLHSIGMKFYKDQSAWRKIAKANKINNPKKKLKPGTILVLP